jgi:hypothetical protein
MPNYGAKAENWAANDIRKLQVSHNVYGLQLSFLNNHILRAFTKHLNKIECRLLLKL